MDEGSGSSVQRKSTSPKKTCDLSTQKFGDIIDTAAFVDKSLFIKAFLDGNHSMIVALAPRRFGKSTNMDMLKEFLSGNKELFEKNELKIWKEEKAFFYKNCVENPIIHVDFKSVSGSTKLDIIEAMQTRLSKAYGNHKYLVKEVGENYTWSDKKLKKVDITAQDFVQYWHYPKTLSERDVIEGFEHLSQCLYVYYGKPVYVLIDEYDAPILEAILETNPEANRLNEIFRLISKIISNFLKGNDYVKRALINACVRIAEVISPDANNIEYYEFLEEPFVEYYGFTAEEVEGLFKREEFVAFKNDKLISQWYNGYKMMDSDVAIYSSYSILKYLDKSTIKKRQTFKKYWVGTGSIKAMKVLFVKSGIRELVEQLINDEEIEIKTVEKMSDENVETLKALVHGNSNEVGKGAAHLFIQFLADNGYLNVIERRETSLDVVRRNVRIPNEEIKTALIDECYNAEFLKEKYNLKGRKIRKYTDAIYSVLQEPNENAFIRLANAVSDLFDKSVMPINEHELHCILFTFVFNVKKYHTHSEFNVKRIKRLGRLRRLEILVILGCVGMIIELKFNDQSSEMAHEQIETSGYSAVFDEPAYKNVTKKILVGLHMDMNRKVGITYTVDGTSKKSITSGE